MKRLTLSLILMLFVGGSTASACICDITCHPGEVYSDEEELCVPIEKTKKQTEQATS